MERGNGRKSRKAVRRCLTDLRPIITGMTLRPWRDPMIRQSGKRNQKWIPAGKSEKEADKKLNELIGDIHNVTYREMQLGHVSIQTTLDRYGHLIREVNTEQVRRLENMLCCVENSDSFSAAKNESVRRFGKK